MINFNNFISRERERERELRNPGITESLKQKRKYSNQSSFKNNQNLISTNNGKIQSAKEDFSNYNTIKNKNYHQEKIWNSSTTLKGVRILNLRDPSIRDFESAKRIIKKAFSKNGYIKINYWLFSFFPPIAKKDDIIKIDSNNLKILNENNKFLEIKSNSETILAIWNTFKTKNNGNVTGIQFFHSLYNHKLRNLEYSNLFQINLKPQKIYFDKKNKNLYKNKTWDINWLPFTLKNAIKFKKDNNEILSWNDIVREFEIKNNQIKSSSYNNRLYFDFEIKPKNDNNHYYEFQEIWIPSIEINLDFLLKFARTSSSYWKNLDNGNQKYWNLIDKPFSKIIFNDDWFKALVIKKTRNEIRNIAYDEFKGINTIYKNEIYNKIENFSIHQYNYKSIFESFKNTRNINIIKNQKPFNFGKFNIDDNISLDEYIYIIKNLNLNFEFGNKIKKNKSYDFNNLNNSKLEIDQKELNDAIATKTIWSNIINVNITSRQNNLIFDDFSKIEINQDKENLKVIYDLKIETSNKDIIHTFSLQTKPVEISDSIVFILETGEILDKDFKVIATSLDSNFKIGDFAYIKTRYFTSYNDQKIFLTINKINDEWFSTKFNKKISDLDQNFNPRNIEYVFNKEMQMIINPYNAKIGKDKIDKDTTQKFGLGKVTSSSIGHKKILESWTDGKWSHSLDQNGKPIFDGAFGIDINGNYDQNGRLKNGNQIIEIDLNKSNISNLKNYFNITIDKEPIKVKVQGTSRILKESKFINNDKIEKLFYSSGPINFSINELDIESIKAQLIDSKGNWYDINVPIKTIKINNEWKLIVDSTIDYAGFARIIVVDQAGNQKTIYFLLKQNSENPNPDIQILESQRLNHHNHKFNQSHLEILKENSHIILNEPLIKDIEIKEIIDNKEVSTNSYILENYEYQIGQDYHYSKPIDGDQKVLKFSGDELKPFLGNESKDTTWSMFNKKITFQGKNKLFKIIINSKMQNNEKESIYIFIPDENKKLLPLIDTNEKTHNLNLKNKQIKNDITDDQNIFSSIEHIFNFYDFELKSIELEFSNLWETNFKKSNWLKTIDKEGKYRIKIKKYNDEIEQFDFLIINKDLKNAKRLEQKILPITKDDQDKTAFWKGKMIWDGYRYHDEDHLLWLKEEIKKRNEKFGIYGSNADKVETNLISANWNGKTSNLPGFNGKNDDFFDRWKFNKTPNSNDEEIKKIKDYWNKISQNNLTKSKNGNWNIGNQNFSDNKKSSNSKVGIIIGSTIGGISLLTLLILIRKKVKIKKWK